MSNRIPLFSACLMLFAMAGSAAGGEPMVKLPPLRAEQVICDQFKPDPRSKLPPQKQCMDAATAFYDEEWRVQFSSILTGNPAGFEALRPTTSFWLPDGSLISGASVGAYVPALLGANFAAFAGASNEFTFKPMDRETIMIFGAPNFSVKTKEGTTASIPSLQLSVYRRCKPSVAPRGWEELAEFWTYPSAFRGPKPVPPATAPSK